MPYTLKTIYNKIQLRNIKGRSDRWLQDTSHSRRNIKGRSDRWLQDTSYSRSSNVRDFRKKLWKLWMYFRALPYFQAVLSSWYLSLHAVSVFKKTGLGQWEDVNDHKTFDTRLPCCLKAAIESVLIISWSLLSSGSYFLSNITNVAVTSCKPINNERR